MKIRRKVSDKKLEANRRNAQLSTGPRTERGKGVVRSNALTYGLFAKDIFNLHCDGDVTRAMHRLFLERLFRQFQPVCIYEEWLVLQIAESMWRLRRASRYENGSIVKLAEAESRREEEEFHQLVAVLPFERNKLFRTWRGLEFVRSLVSEAARDVRETGMLSSETRDLLEKVYDDVPSLFTSSTRTEPDARETTLMSRGQRSSFDTEAFLTWAAEKEKGLALLGDPVSRMENQKFEGQALYFSLPPERDMEKILRYEKRMHKQLDRALQELEKVQRARKGNGTPITVCQKREFKGKRGSGSEEWN